MTDKPTTDVALTVNGTDRELTVEPRKLLVHAIRDDLDLTGTHVGCDTGNCGACTVIVDGEALKSCLLFAAQAEGSEILTVEGMEELPEAGGELHPVQEGFREEHGLQCGFCTPGMILAGKALLDESPDPSEADIRRAISGNLCRCTGYQNIVKSIQYAADHLGTAAGGPAEEAVADGGEPSTARRASPDGTSGGGVSPDGGRSDAGDERPGGDAR